MTSSMPIASAPAALQHLRQVEDFRWTRPSQFLLGEQRLQCFPYLIYLEIT